MSKTHIAQLVARKLDVPMRKPFGISGGAQHVASNVLVELILEEGGRGWGEGAPFPAFNGETQAEVLAACKLAAPLLDGCSIHDSDLLAERVRDACKGSPSARCAIETAIVDARARLAGMSLRSVFGNAEDEITTDITITTGSVDDARREALELTAFRTLKVKVAGKDATGRADVDLDIARVRAIREARKDARILVDANGGYTLDEALHLAKTIARLGIILFEQPIAPGNWEAMAEIRKRTRIRVGLDESITCADDVVRAVQNDAADAINMKIMKSGIFETIHIIDRAREAGLDRMIGGMVETRLAMGMSACIAAGVGGFKIIDLDTPLFLAEDPFEGGYVQTGETLDLRPIRLGHGTTPRK